MSRYGARQHRKWMRAGALGTAAGAGVRVYDDVRITINGVELTEAASVELVDLGEPQPARLRGRWFAPPQTKYEFEMVLEAVPLRETER